MNRSNEMVDYLRENIRTLPAVVMIALLLAGYLLFGLIVVWPQWQARSDLKSRLETAASTLTPQLQPSSTRPDEAEAAQQQLVDAASLFLTESEAAVVLSDLSRYAAESGVAIVDLQAQTGPDKEPQSVYDVRQFTVYAQGELVQLIDFVTRIRETAVPGILLTNLNLDEGPEADMLTFDLQLYTSPYATESSLANLPAAPTSLPTAVSTPIPTADSLADQLHQPWSAQDWPAAMALIDQILALDPAYPGMVEKLYAVHVNYGYQLLAQRDEAAARQEFEQAMAVNPNGTEAAAALQSLTAETTLRVPTIYVVQRGDTLFSIARRYNVTVDALQAANGLVGNGITPGQELTIP